MVMNNNTISFRDFKIEVPKIDEDQYILLRLILLAIEKKQIKLDRHYIEACLLPANLLKDMDDLLSKNIQIKVDSKIGDSTYFFYVMNDIELTKEFLLFIPAKIVKEIIEESTTSSKKSFLKYILFHGIRSKQTLLFLDYLLKRNEPRFEISIEDLRVIFELEEKYKNFNSLQKFVIQRAIDEINANTNIAVDHKITKKDGRKVTHLAFTYFSKSINREV
jgi:plasmid replication initiation protein